MNIIDKLEESLINYLETHPYPKYMYTGEQECVAMDREFGGITLEKFGCQIVQVMARSWLTWGD